MTSALGLAKSRLGGFENNWIQTNTGKGWFTPFGFYGPTEPFFDKSWKLADIEKVN